MESSEMEFTIGEVGIAMREREDGMFVVTKVYEGRTDSVVLGIVLGREVASALFLASVKKLVREWETDA